MAGLMGMDREVFLRSFRRARLFSKYPGPAPGGQGDAFPMKEARRRARVLQDRLLSEADRVVFVGRAVSTAFGFSSPYLCWEKWQGRRAAVIPHPSGVNRWWNDADNTAAARAFLSKIPAGGFDEESVWVNVGKVLLAERCSLYGKKLFVDLPRGFPPVAFVPFALVGADQLRLDYKRPQPVAGRRGRGEGPSSAKVDRRRCRVTLPRKFAAGLRAAGVTELRVYVKVG